MKIEISTVINGRQTEAAVKPNLPGNTCRCGTCKEVPAVIQSLSEKRPDHYCSLAIDTGGRDLMINDLRTFLNLLEEKKDLVHISRPTSPQFEIAAGIRKTSDIEGPALLFDNVPGHSMPVVGGLYAVRRRAVWGWRQRRSRYTVK